MKSDEALGVALEALEKIAKHEKECGERWAEALTELKNLKSATDNHAKRWEKLAWLIIGAIVTTGAAASATLLSI
tara:strand:- start:338 stop:562 length:225 start_codon:yes stop_codon:yes gene_type:complete